MKKRESGILLHISSLPSAFGIGDLGPWAYKFADFLHKTKQSYWQILPLNPTSLINGNSPYSSISAFAANTLLISPELMVEEGFLEKKVLEIEPSFCAERVDYRAVITYKEKLFNLAYEHFQSSPHKSEYERFCLENANWLDDFALFVASKAHFQGKVWRKWPEEIRDRKQNAMDAFREKLFSAVEKEKLLQFIFYKQWRALKSYCGGKGIQLIGDISIYVTFDSADAWANAEIFKLDENKEPIVIAGVPPDYFSRTGQLWGNPVYRWDVLKNQGYDWWMQRIEHNLKLFDCFRIDHFRGFVDFWQVAAQEKTAINGSWEKAPAMHFFETLLKRFPNLFIIAEDLGIITDEVREVMRHFDFPGMKVLLFAFGEDNPKHPYLPHNYIHNSVVYTGTHDNNTVKGWFEKEATAQDKKRLFRYFGYELDIDKLHLAFVRMAMMSVANIALFPLQDILGLGAQERMNLPGTVNGNWQWRLLPEQMTNDLSKQLADLTELYGRAK